MRHRRGEASGRPCPLARLRPESAEHLTPLAVTTEAAFVAAHAVGKVGTDRSVTTVPVNPFGQVVHYVAEAVEDGK